MECLHEALQEKRSDKKNPGFECENEIQSSDTVENLITGCQSDVCEEATTITCDQAIFFVVGKKKYA